MEPSITSHHHHTLFPVLQPPPTRVLTPPVAHVFPPSRLRRQWSSKQTASMSMCIAKSWRTSLGPLPKHWTITKSPEQRDPVPRKAGGHQPGIPCWTPKHIKNEVLTLPATIMELNDNPLLLEEYHLPRGQAIHFGACFMECSTQKHSHALHLPRHGPRRHTAPPGVVRDPSSEGKASLPAWHPRWSSEGRSLPPFIVGWTPHGMDSLDPV